MPETFTSQPANPFISVDRIRQQLTFEVDENDEVILKDILDSCLAFIKRKVGQGLELADYKEPIACKSNIYQMNERPVQRVYRVSCLTNALFVTCGGIRPLVSVTNDSLILSQFGSGELSEVVIDFDTYPTIQSVATKISTITNWTATVMGEIGAYPSDDLAPCGGQPAKSKNLYSYSNDVSFDFRLPAALVLGFIPSFSQVQVKYQAGYQFCPDDMAQLIARMCQYELAAREADMVYTSESLGGYSYSLNPAKAFESLGGWAEEVLKAFMVDRIRGANVVA